MRKSLKSKCIMVKLNFYCKLIKGSQQSIYSKTCHFSTFINLKFGSFEFQVGINVSLVSIQNTYMAPSYTARELKWSKLKIWEQRDDKQLTVRPRATRP